MFETAATETKRTISLLLVEDHTLTRMGLKAALKRTEDIQVIGEAANGQEAIDAAEKFKPDVILMDVGMPVLDGIQASREILTHHPEIRIIMLTQHDNEQDIMASLSAGASGYCLKDVEPERLYTAIRAVASGDIWLDSSIASRVLKIYLGNMKTDAARSAEPSRPNFETQSNLPDSNTDSNTDSNKLNANKTESNSSDYPYVEALSPRELEVLGLIVDGMSNQQIADKLIISLPTAKTHVRNILNKLAVDDRTQAAVQAMRRGLV